MQDITQFYYLIGSLNSLWVQGLVTYTSQFLNNSFFLLRSNSKFITRILNQF